MYKHKISNHPTGDGFGTLIVVIVVVMTLLTLKIFGA